MLSLAIRNKTLKLDDRVKHNMIPKHLGENPHRILSNVNTPQYPEKFEYYPTELKEGWPETKNKTLFGDNHPQFEKSTINFIHWIFAISTFYV